MGYTKEKTQEIASIKHVHLQRGDEVGACERKLDKTSFQGLLPYALGQVLGEGMHPCSLFSGVQQPRMQEQLCFLRIVGQY